MILSSFGKWPSFEASCIGTLSFVTHEALFRIKCRHTYNYPVEADDESDEEDNETDDNDDDDDYAEWDADDVRYCRIIQMNSIGIFGSLT